MVGMNRHEYLHSTPNDVYAMIRATNKLRHDQMMSMESMAWLTGAYVRAAIGSTFGKAKYPNNPMESANETMYQASENSGKTQEELKQELMLATLMIQKANAEVGAFDSMTQG